MTWWFYVDYQALQKKEIQIKSDIKNNKELLSDLPKESLNFMPWTLGYRSSTIAEKNTNIVLEIEFPEPASIDSIIILPATYTEDTHQLMSFGFPKRFEITSLDQQRILVDYRNRDYATPGIEPQVFELDEKINCTGLRFVTHELVEDATWWSEKYNFSLSEIYAFSGEKNVSLQSKVTASHHNTFSYIWNPNNLVDGFSLFSPVIRKSIHPLKYTFMPRTTQCNLLYINENEEVLDEVRLWPVIHSLQHNYPPSSGLGFPQNITISCSDNVDFNSPEIIYKSPDNMPKPGSNPLCIPLPARAKKYYLFELNDPLIDHRSKTLRISLAEIEWISQGLPINTGKWERYPSGKYPHIEFINDGYSNEGRILPLKESLLGLNLRAKLEKEISNHQQNLAFLQGQKNEKIRNLFFAGFSLIIILILIILIIRFYALKKWHELRESIAEDLHDEVGANLSSIAQYNELLKQSCASALNEQQRQLFDRAIKTTRETSQQTRHLIQFLEQKGKQDSLNVEIKNLCQKMLPPLTYTLDLGKDDKLQHLKTQYKWHLTMFIKEALNNIKKHAQAKEVHLALKSHIDGWLLEIVDDGIGFSPENHPPLHLKSRSQKLHAELNIISQTNYGTQLHLYLKKHHFN